MANPINGTTNADTLTGTAGDDVINGLGGNDKIDGGAGADQIDGGAGNDIIKGGDGNDVVTGGLGNDSIVGGAGQDTALYLNTSIAAASTGGSPIGSWSGSLLTLATGTVDGTDILNQVESLNFNGQTFAVNGYNATTPYNVVANLGADGATTTDDGAGASGNVLANDYDVDSQLTVTGARANNDLAGPPAMPSNDPKALAVNGIDVVGQYGTLHINTNGTYSYLANGGGSGVDHFQYSVTDGGATRWVSLDFTVNHVNRLPVAQAASAATNEDTLLSGSVQATDADHENLTYSLVAGPAHGSLTFHSDGTYSYIPDADYNGSDSFTFKANDGHGDSNTATAYLYVNPVNDVPVAADASAGTNEDTVMSGSVSATDADGDSLTYGVASGPQHGSLSFNSDGTYTYTPNANYHGSDSFDFSVSDGHGGTDYGHVTIDVASLNDAPVAAAGSASTSEDTPVSGSLHATDADGDSLTYGMASAPQHGSVTVNSDGTYTYTPDANYHGSDSFDFWVSDSLGDTDYGHVTVNVGSVNDVPVAADGSASTNEDTAVSGSAHATDADGDSLTYGVASGPAHGSLSFNSDGSYTYTPNANYHGSDSFDFSVSDGHGGTDTGHVTINVASVNDVPVAADASASTSEDTAVSGSVHATDVDGDSLTYAVASGPEAGSLSFNSDGTYTYTPNANFNGADGFDFSVSDGHGGTDYGHVSINVSPVNDPPTASNGSGAGSEDGLISGWASASDADGDALTYSVVSGPAHGSVSLGSDGHYFYTPDANYNGSDSFTFRVNDGHGNSNTATISLTVGPVNDLPVAATGSAAGPEDTVISGSVHATDVDGDSLTYALAGSGPAHGSLSFNSDGTFTFTPDANYHGPDSFQFTASDGHGNSNTATFYLDVDPPVNDNTVAYNGSASGNEDTAISGSVSASDVDGDSLTYSVVSGPAHGSLSFNSDGTYSYTPNADYNGSDSFTFKASDGTADSNTATVSLTVNPVQDAPVAADASASTNEDTALSGSVHATDADGDSLAYAMASGPAHGSLSFNSDGSYTYTPAANYHGSDSFDFSVSDGHGGTDYGHVAINVASVNDAPVVTPTVSVSTFSGADAFAGWATMGHTGGGAGSTGTGWSGQAGIVYGDGVTLEQISAFADATGLDAVIPGVQTSGSGVRLDFDTTAGQTWEIRLRFSTGDTVDGDAAFFISDESGQIFSTRMSNNGNNLRLHNDSTTAGHHTLYLVVIGGGNAGAVPQLQIDGFLINGVAANIDTTHSYVKEDSVLNSHVYASDPDGDAVTFSLASGGQASHGTVAVNANGSFTYTPTGNYSGSDSFTYQVSDGHGGVTTATQLITVEAVADAPVAADASASTNEDTTLSGAVHATDADGDTLTYALGATTTHGSLSFNSDGTYSYTPSANYHGSDSFTFTVSDGHGGTSTGHITINVASVNDVPVAADASTGTSEDTAVSGSVQATDADGDSLTYGVASGPQHGSLSFNSDGTYTYTPNANYHGSDSFDFSVSDGHGGTDYGHVTIDVASVNDVPVAADGSASTSEDTAVSGSVHATDADGDSLTYATASGPQHGSLTMGSDGTYTYTPNANYHGSDSFDFSVSDGHGGTDYGHVTVNVSSVNDVPVAQSASFGGNEDTTISGQVHATDADGDSLTYSLYAGAPGSPSGAQGIQAPGTQHGSLSFHSDGTFTYTPNANYHGSDSFTFRAYDGTAYSAPVTVYLNVASVNDTPVANAAGTVNTGEDTAVSGQASGSDADGDSLTWSTVATLDGLSFNSDGSWTFDPTANAAAQGLNDGESADLTFSYRAYDGLAYSNTVIATVHVTGSTEVLTGTALRDVLNGSAYGDNINGLAGNDDLYGNAGNDTINGGDGSDKLYGGDGADTLNGGIGVDTVNGDAGSDTLSGGDGADTMDGGDDVDIVHGNADNDVVKGGAGNDFVYGDAGDDNVQGGTGDDFVYGGAGKDSLNGGTGADTFVFADGDLTNSAATTDTITDFKAAQGDILDLHSIDANTNVIGDQAFSFVGSFSHHAGEMTLSYSSGTNTTTLALDTNGDGVADYLLLLTGNVNNPNGWLL